MDGLVWIPREVSTVSLGPNGAGKSTTIKVLTGLLDASAGELRFWALIHAVSRRTKRQGGVVPEDLGLFRPAHRRGDAFLRGQVHGLSKT